MGSTATSHPGRETSHQLWRLMCLTVGGGLDNRGLGTYLDPRDPDQLLLLRTPQSTREPPAPVRTRRGDRVRIAGKVGFYLVLNAPKSLWTVQMPSRIAYGASATSKVP
jgi:hypothetical protein